MRPCVLLAVVAVTVAVGFAPAPFPRKERATSRDDLESMQGLWRMTRYDSNGNPIGHNYKCRIKGNRWTFVSLDNGRETESSTYVLNLDYRVAPRAFEWKHQDTPTSDGWCGSYKLEPGRRLRLVFGSGTLRTNLAGRPTDFDGNAPYKMELDFIGR